MKKKIAILFTGILVLVMWSNVAHAGRGGFVQYSYGTWITKIADLDVKSGISASDDNPKLGWKHERTSLYWMPVWGTTQGNYVIYTEAGDGWRSIPVPPEMLSELNKELNLNLTQEPPISIFSLFWGWLVYGPLIVLAIMGVAKNKRLASQSAEKTQTDPMEMELARMVATANSSGYAQRPAQQSFGQSSHHGKPVFGKRR